ncbi:MAG: hypothetical protein J5793_04020 [Clostridia bacterium]|nr:hypothetical protein [Clostridia bacterium]
MDSYRKLRLRITVSRGNLLFFTILTAFNILIFTINGTVDVGWYVPYSSFICTQVMAVLISSGLPVLGTLLSLLIDGALLLCYFKSKTSSKWLFAALVFTVLDLASVLFLMIVTGDYLNFLLELVMRLLVLLYTATGVISYNKLDKLGDTTDGETGDAPERQEIPFEAEGPETPGKEPSGRRLYKNDGKQVLTARFRGRNILAAKSDEKLYLVINGWICAECDYYGGEAELGYREDGLDIRFKYSDSEKMLFGNGKPLI